MRIIEIASLIDLLPPKIYWHMFRTGKFVAALSQLIYNSSISSSNNDLLYYGEAAFFHDIGKAFIPLEIINKTGETTQIEACAMKFHTVCAQVGFMDVKRGRITGIPEHLVNLAAHASVCHHECWNGTGYPYKMKYREIPLIARITSICNTYDSMVNSDNGEEAFSHREACNAVHDGSGTLFDPLLVKLFIENDSCFELLYRDLPSAENKKLPYNNLFISALHEYYQMPQLKKETKGVKEWLT